MPPGFAANVGAANDPAANRIVVAVIIQREISMAPSSLMFAVSDDGDGSEPTARAVIVFACPTNLRWPLAQSKRCARTPAVHIRPGPPRIVSGLRLCIRVCRTGPLPKRILLPACRPACAASPISTASAISVHTTHHSAALTEVVADAARLGLDIGSETELTEGPAIVRASRFSTSPSRPGPC